MIEINTSFFDMEVINNIYQNEEFINNLVNSIKTNLEGNSHIVVKELLQTWLCDESGAPNQSKIIHYLLNTTPEEYIESFYQKAAEKIEGNAALGEVLKVWPTPLENALNIDDYALRKQIIAEVITPNSLCMFSGITKADLDAEPTRNTLWSNKTKLKLIKLQHSKDYEKLKTTFEEIFDYDKFSVKYRTKLLAAMKVTVCPYCNRQYITIYDTIKENKATADLDHFFCKDLYPFLALSLYNFVPSCQICNSRFKLAKDFYKHPHVNPYRAGFADNCVFKFETLHGLIDDKDPKYSLFNSINNTAIDNSIETFHLNSVYQSHIDYVKELITKVKLYNTSQILEYLSNFPELFGSRAELLQLLYGTYLNPNEVGLRPLSKLTQDILKDLCVEF